MTDGVIAAAYDSRAAEYIDVAGSVDQMDAEDRALIEQWRDATPRYPHLRFDHGSFRDLPYEDASFGGILAWYSLIHTPPEDVPAILNEFARVLALGGSLLLGYFDGPPREQFAHAIAPAYFWSADALEALLRAAGFILVRQERRTRDPNEVSRRPHGAVHALRVRHHL